MVFACGKAYSLLNIRVQNNQERMFCMFFLWVSKIVLRTQENYDGKSRYDELHWK